jgi:hypothetical protein
MDQDDARVNVEFNFHIFGTIEENYKRESGTPLKHLMRHFPPLPSVQRLFHVDRRTMHAIDRIEFPANHLP